MALQQEYFSIPPITRAYTTTCLLTTIAVVSDELSLSLFISPSCFCSSNWSLSLRISCISILNWSSRSFKWVSPIDSRQRRTNERSICVCLLQLWRLITCFCFYGGIGFNFFFNLLFTYRYCRHLEEGSFRGRAADFLLMFLFGGTLMIIMALFVNIVFLGSALTIMLVYVWSRRNPFVRMNFFGLLNFQAPYLPWVLLAFSLLLGNSIIVDLMGIVVGHIYYFLEDIFPREPGGFRLLKTPRFL